MCVFVCDWWRQLLWKLVQYWRRLMQLAWNKLKYDSCGQIHNVNVRKLKVLVSATDQLRLIKSMTVAHKAFLLFSCSRLYVTKSHSKVWSSARQIVGAPHLYTWTQINTSSHQNYPHPWSLEYIQPLKLMKQKHQTVLHMTSSPLIHSQLWLFLFSLQCTTSRENETVNVSGKNKHF